MSIETKLRVRVLADAFGRAGGPEPVVLTFDPADPAVVVATFAEAESPDPASSDVPRWLLDRQILAHGGGVPNGDVRADRDRKWLTLTLTSPEGSCRVALPVAELDVFLADTYKLVPLGEEITELHIDDAIANLLGSTP